jgi:hypothetical protein
MKTVWFLVTFVYQGYPADISGPLKYEDCMYYKQHPYQTCLSMSLPKSREYMMKDK